MKRTFALAAVLPIVMAGAAHAQGVGLKGGLVV
jgi:hypothetical protein